MFENELRLYIVRHGHSVANYSHAYSGQSNVPLAPDGFDDARSAGRLLCNVAFAKVYCSELLRARQTCETAMPNVAYETDARLNEVSVGDLAGVMPEDAQAKYGEVHAWARAHRDFTAFGGENHEIFLTWIDRVADFLNSLQTSYGVKVPVLFRPWHEHTGSWFWWGQNLCSTEQYKALWVLTENRLKEDGVTNALFAYSPGSEYWEHEEMYLERYPGDEYIDVIGFDHYCTAQEGDTLGLKKYTEQLEILLTTLCCVAEKHGKVPAITETGYESVKCDNWWTTFLQPACDKFPIAYVLTWRNAHDKPGHLYAPYPGQQSAEDFVAFYNADKTLFVQDLNGLYLEKTSKAEE